MAFYKFEVFKQCKHPDFILCLFLQFFIHSPHTAYIQDLHTRRTFASSITHTGN